MTKTLNLFRLKTLILFSIVISTINLFLFYMLGQTIFSKYINIFLSVIIGEIFFIINILFIYFYSYIKKLESKINEQNLILKSIKLK